MKQVDGSFLLNFTTESVGKPYGSKKEAERALVLGSGTVSYWVKNRPEKARIITIEEYKEAIKLCM